LRRHWGRRHDPSPERGRARNDGGSPIASLPALGWARILARLRSAAKVLVARAQMPDGFA